MKAYQCIIIAALSLLTVIFSAIAIFTSGSNASAKNQVKALNISDAGMGSTPIVGDQPVQKSTVSSTVSSLVSTPTQTPTRASAAQHRNYSPLSPEHVAEAVAGIPNGSNASAKNHVEAQKEPETPTCASAAQHRKYSPSSPEDVAAAVAGITNNGASLLSPV